MILRSFFTAVLSAVLVAIAAPAEAAEPQRLVVVDAMADGSLSAHGREGLRKAIADVIGREGLVQVPSDSLPERLQHCEVPGCLAQVGAASGATLVLALEGIFAKERFNLTVSLWNADDGKRLGKETRDCPICDEQDLWGTAALVAQGLLERHRRQDTARATAPGPAPQAVPAETTDQGQGGASGLLVASGLVLALAGVTSLVAGTYYIAVDGKSACDGCDRVRDTRKFGLPLAIVGGVAVVGGAGLLAWAWWPRQTQLSLGPSGVQLAGTFQ